MEREEGATDILNNISDFMKFDIFYMLFYLIFFICCGVALSSLLAVLSVIVDSFV